jgi:hypothetical protein
MQQTPGDRRRESVKVQGECPWVAAASYFALVFGAGFLFGLVRVPLVVPRLGERAAELLEAPVMFGVMFFASRYVTRRFALATSPRRALSAGLLALALMIATELLLAVALQGRSVAGYIAGRDPVSGSVYLVSLLVYGALPWLHARRRGMPDGEAVRIK